MSPVWAQYAGPAILSRGEAPAAMKPPTIEFRPFVDFATIYDTGLSDAELTQTGGLANTASAGIRVAAGVSGTHNWKRTSVGVDYRGSYTDYRHQTVPRSFTQSLLMGVTHQLTPHLKIDLRESAGMFTRDFGLAGLAQTVPFDPSSTFIPTTDYFDNRTYYSSTQAQATLQKTARLSFNMAGGFVTNRRSSNSLYSVNGQTAEGDAQYRLTRASTVGAVYQYNRFEYSHHTGGSDVHIFTGAYSMRPTRRVEFSAQGGVARVESKFFLAQAVDPVIAQLLGITTNVQVLHTIAYHPYTAARLSRVFSKGIAYVTGGSNVTPGNGVFLTSYTRTVMGGYEYTGLRRWSMNAQAGDSWSDTTGNATGSYRGVTGNMSVSRSLGGSAHFTASFSARQYQSASFSQYNRLIYSATVGIGFTPGDVPLRIW
jgi:hypothetical protein